jgi:spoIIIJ-associated protein
MGEMEISGKTVEEAIQKALEQLGVSRNEVEVTILSEGRSGILGLGAEEARVRVKTLVPVADSERPLAGVAKEVLERLLAMMEVSASVTQVAVVPVTLNIKGDDLGILIGRRGQTLACLQHIVRLIVSHQTKVWLPVIIDVEEYKQRRYQALEALAYRMAEQVKVKRVPFTLEPMPAYERRIIHLALADHPDVTTQSIGEGETRKVVITPKRR